MKKTQLEIFEEIQAKLTEINPDWDISPSSIDYQANQALSQLMADAYDYAERASTALDIDSADLVQLRNIAYTLGLPLKNQSQSQVTVELTATSDILLPSGTRFLNASGNVFVLPQAAELTEATTAHLLHSLEYGAIGFSADTYTLEATNDAITINQVADSFVLGSNPETEIELKKRIQNTTARNGLNTVDALTSRLYEESVIAQVKIIVNRNNYFIDFDGEKSWINDGPNSISPHSTLILIDFNYPSQAESNVTDAMKNAVFAAIAESYSVAENLNGGRGDVITPSEYTGNYTTPTTLVNIGGVNKVIGGSSTSVTFYTVSRIYLVMKVTLISFTTNIELTEEFTEKAKDNIIRYAAGGYGDIGLRNRPYDIGEDVDGNDFECPVQFAFGQYVSTSISFLNRPTGGLPKYALAIFERQNITFEVQQ